MMPSEIHRAADLARIEAHGPSSTFVNNTTGTAIENTEIIYKIIYRQNKTDSLSEFNDLGMDYAFEIFYHLLSSSAYGVQVIYYYGEEFSYDYSPGFPRGFFAVVSAINGVCDWENEELEKKYNKFLIDEI